VLLCYTCFLYILKYLIFVSKFTFYVNRPGHIWMCLWKIDCAIGGIQSMSFCILRSCTEIFKCRGHVILFNDSVLATMSEHRMDHEKFLLTFISTCAVASTWPRSFHLANRKSMPSFADIFLYFSLIEPISSLHFELAIFTLQCRYTLCSKKVTPKFKSL